MIRATWNYCANLARLLRRDRVLYPLAVAYYVTTQCNLNCAYCEDFGLRRNRQTPAPSLEDALRVLRVVRSAVDSLILTGGEPLLHPDIVPLVTDARRTLKFRHLTLQTNGLLLAEYEEILPNLDRLVVSLDSVNPVLWSALIDAPVSTAETILDNVRIYASKQREYGYRMIVNCVLSPETLSSAQGVLEFCFEHRILASFSPQAVNNWPRYELLVSDDYRTFLKELLGQKRRGAPILGSEAYLRTISGLLPYSCYPTLVARILPNGDLLYPCRPIEKGGTSHGGRPCNLLEVKSWKQALAVAQAQYGPPPRVCTSCYQQCFVEPSLMQAKPQSLLYEWLRYRASRQGGVTNYAPG
jgi:MoaA/NifB/PqqE/SkfB family radical SAM enzyme